MWQETIRFLALEALSDTGVCFARDIDALRLGRRRKRRKFQTAGHSTLTVFHSAMLIIADHARCKDVTASMTSSVSLDARQVQWHRSRSLVRVQTITSRDRKLYPCALEVDTTGKARSHALSSRLRITASNICSHIKW